MATTSAAAKTANKTARSPRNGAEIPLGAHPGNTGGKKGRSGRPKAKFKAFLAKLRDDPEFQQAIEDAATDPSSRGFSAALKLVTDYDDEKPAQRVQIDVGRIKSMSNEELRAIVAGKAL